MEQSMDILGKRQQLPGTRKSVSLNFSYWF